MRTVFCLAVLVCGFGALFGGGDKQLRRLDARFHAKMKECRWAEAQRILKDMVGLWSKKSVEHAAVLAIETKRGEFVDAVEAALMEAEDDEGKLKVVADVAVSARDWRVRLMALRAIRFAQKDVVRKTVIALLKDKEPAVLREAVNAALIQGGTDIIAALIELYGRVEKERGLVWLKTRQALATLCGIDFEEAKKWREWFAEQKSRLKEKEKQGKLEKDEERGMTVVDMVKKSAPKFFGTEVVSTRVIFLIDVSSSMQARDPKFIKTPDGQIIQKTKLPKNAVRDDWGGYPCLAASRARIARVKRELIKCIKGLPPKAKFNIIAFATGLKRWRKRLVFASKGNKSQAIAFVRSLKAEGDTYTDDAIKAAFADPEIDTIYLLSDGQPWRGNSPIDVDNILQWVKENNRFRKIIIHTFGFEQARSTPNMDVAAMMKLLKGLAQQTGGSFTNIYW